MREKRLYRSPQAEENGGGKAFQVEREIHFSDLERDFRWMRDNVPCQEGCPAFTNIPGYIRCLYEGRYGRSYELNRMANMFPGVLGRICSRPCEAFCRHGETDLGEPVGICHVKRAAADLKSQGHRIQEHLFAHTGKRIAVVGAGPAGLACAHDLACFGHEVTLYEARERTGGMLTYGIPTFRLPDEVIQSEVQNILRLGIDCRTGVALGRDVQASQLLADHDALVVAAGCYDSRTLGVEGEELHGVWPGLDFMMKVNRGDALGDLGRVLVIGGGFTAMDCARSAFRKGAQSVKVAILTTEEDMFATAEEIHEAKREGVEIQPLLMTRAFHGAEGLEAIEFIRTRPGRMLDIGMHEPIPIEGSEFRMEIDTVIVAIGQAQQPGLIDLELDTDERGNPLVDPETFRCGPDGLYLIGDFATGPATVIESVGAAKRAACRISEQLLGLTQRKPLVRFEHAEPSDRERSWDFIDRVPMPTLPVEARLADPDGEVELGLDDAQGLEETKRCYLCYLRFEIDVDRCIYCRYCIDVAPRDCIKLVRRVETDEAGHMVCVEETNDWSEVMAVVIDNARCIRCGNCYRVCPTRCIGVTKVERVELDLEPQGEGDYRAPQVAEAAETGSSGEERT